MWEERMNIDNWAKDSYKVDVESCMCEGTDWVVGKQVGMMGLSGVLGKVVLDEEEDDNERKLMI